MEEFEHLLADVLEESVAATRLLNRSFPAVTEELRAVDPRLLAFSHDSLDFATRRLTALQHLCGDEFFRLDAQIVHRTYLECLTRLMYVATHTRKEVVETLLPEMYDDLHELQFLRTSVNVQPSLGEGAVTSPSDRNLLSGGALPVEEEERLRKRLGKKERNRINQKYSFSEMAKKIAEADPGLKPYTALLHTYNQASHIAHADLLGLALVRDHEEREEVPKALLSLSHRASMIADAVSLMLLTYRLLYRFVGKVFDTTEAARHLDVIQDASGAIRAAFYATQAHLYEEDASPT